MSHPRLVNFLLFTKNFIKGINDGQNVAFLKRFLMTQMASRRFVPRIVHSKYV